MKKYIDFPKKYQKILLEIKSFVILESRVWKEYIKYA